ncbi:MAG: FIG028593: membrane protein [uncultured Paraburkholderia sp.]|nr:MAG: FIG028593: membrane protein [uncultured Paraburkholderia sp.]
MVSNFDRRDYAGFDRGAASMRTLTQQLTHYAAYHRDRRNIATHFVGIPMIVLALAVLLSRPAFALAALPVTLSPAWLLFVAATLYYLVLDIPLGLMMAAVSALCIAFGQWIAAQSTLVWLTTGVGLFVIGWVFQFIGHVAYEHRKPAFVDDVVGLLIGPLFVLAEALFEIGWRPALRDAIEREAGPTRVNPDRAAAHR